MSDNKTSKEELRRRLAEEQRIRDEDALDPAKLAVDDLVGRRGWKRSKFGYITGLGAIKDGFGSFSEVGKGSKGRVEDIGKAAFAQDKRGRSIDQDIEGSQDRFRAAMQANNKRLTDVNNSVANTYRHFWFYIALMAVALVLGVVSFLFYGLYIPSFPLFDILFRAMPLPVLGALALRAGYTNWMFRKRRLDSLAVYLGSGEILPRKPAVKVAGVPAVVKDGTTMTRSNTIKALALFAGLAFSLLSFGVHPVEASGVSGPADPGQQIFQDPAANTTDRFITMLSFLVPGVGPIPDNGEIEVTNPQAKAVKVAFMAFSGTLLFLAAMVSGWQIITGLVASAKEGTVLGKQYHEVWAPIRVVFGFGMLAPIAGGLCAAQIICLYLVVWGGNLANIVWVPYITSVSESSSSSSGIMASETIRSANNPIANDTIKNLLQRELCWSIANAYLTASGDLRSGIINRNADNGGTTPPDWDKGTPPLANDIMGTNYVYHYIDYGAACGMIEVRVPNVREGSPEEVLDNQSQITVANSQLTAIKDMIGPLRGIAKQAGQTYINNDGAALRYFDPANDEALRSSGIYKIFEDLRSGYVTGVTSAAVVTDGSTDEKWNAAVTAFVEKSRQDGWSAAGAYYVSIARMQNSVYQTSMKSANFTTASHLSITSEGNWPYYLRDVMWGDVENPGGLIQFQGWWDKQFKSIDPDQAEEVMQIANHTGGVGDLMDPVFGSISRMLVNDEDINPLNPMQNMIDLGNKMMAAGSLTYIASAAVGGAASNQAQATSAVPIFGALSAWFVGGILNVVTTVMTLATMIATALIAAGAVHAFVIPLIPYVMTAFFVGGMALLTAEALVAAPLWAFFHIRMDGDSFVSEVQKPGYMIAFNLLLRPSLMIFGLILSYLVFGGMAWFVENTFYDAASGLAASTSIGPLGTVVILLIVTYIHFQLAVRAFSMILQVPDRVTRWFGQGGERLGEEEDAGKATAFIVGQASGKLDNLSRGGALGSRPKSTKPIDPTEKLGEKPTSGGGQGEVGKSEQGKPAM